MKKNERWKEIKNYEGLYWVSDQGRIKSKYGFRKLNRNKRGYVIVGLCKNGKQCTYLVHRLVALAFIPNPKPHEYNCINHLDEVKHNNEYTNLEWTNVAENNRYGTGYSRRMKTKSSNIQKKGVPVYSLRINKDGSVELKSYKSIYEASMFMKVDTSSISRCCKGLMKTTGGCHFFYK